MRRKRVLASILGFGYPAYSPTYSFSIRATIAVAMEVVMNLKSMVLFPEAL